MNDLEVQGLCKRFGENVIVDEISFQVAEGEFFVLLGPSGGGKTTLLRLLCGLEKADSGKIIMAGREVTSLPARERNIGMVFQDYGLYPHMNVFQNIAYGLEARGLPREEIDRRVPQAAARLGLQEFLKAPVVDLSGGEQQRVALARAMAKDADLYLYDEPLSNLDPKLRAQARRDILMIHREKHRPTVYVTHDQTEALAIGDRIGIIASGRLQQVGTAEALVEHPENLFVASFIGSPPMNLLRGRLRSGAAGFQFEGQGFSLPLPAQWQPFLAGYAQDEIVAGLRPSAAFDPGLPGAALPEHLTTLTGVVMGVEPLIGETIVMLDLGSGTSFNALFQGGEETLVPGRAIQVSLDLGQLVLFDPQTGRALQPRG